MKICNTHWTELSKAIDDRGLFHLVSKSGSELVEKIKIEVVGLSKSEDYDPLWNANMMIGSRALEVGGAYLVMGDYCPLCEAESHLGVGTATEWINGCSDSILEYCKAQGLIGGPGEG